jgi:DNA-binding NtrC family response regulator
MSSIISEVAANHAQLAIDFFDGDKRKAADCLGVSLSTLYRRLACCEGVGR